MAFSFSQILILLLLGLLFFKENLLSWIRQYFGLDAKEPDGASADGILKKVLQGQNQLQAHFNHDTTKLLSDILDEQREHNKTELEVHQGLREGFLMVKGKFDEYDRVGVKSRCETK